VSDASMVERLLQAGLKPTMLASVLDIPLDDVLAMLPEERRRAVKSDAAIESAMRELAWRTIEEAMLILDEGNLDLKMKLISKFGGDMARVMSATDKDDMADMRDEFKSLTRSLRGDTDAMADTGEADDGE